MWEGSCFEGDLVLAGKPIIAVGGAGFIQNLSATGLIDAYQLAVHPVLLG